MRPLSVCSPANEEKRVSSCWGKFCFPFLPQLAARSIPREGVRRKLCHSSTSLHYCQSLHLLGRLYLSMLSDTYLMYRYTIVNHLALSRVNEEAQVLKIQLWVIFVAPPQVHCHVFASVLQHGPQSWMCTAQKSFWYYAGRWVTSTVVLHTQVFI